MSITDYRKEYDEWREKLNKYAVGGLPSLGDPNPASIICDKLTAVLFKSYAHEPIGTRLSVVLKDRHNVECDFTNYERKTLFLKPSGGYSVTWSMAGGKINNDIRHMVIFLYDRKLIEVPLRVYTDGYDLNIKLDQILIS